MCALTHGMCVSQSTMSVKSKITSTHVYGCVYNATCVQYFSEGVSVFNSQ